MDTPKEGGVIVFLQSYGYKELFMKKLEASDLWEQIKDTRKIYDEKKDKIEVFSLYQKSI